MGTLLPKKCSPKPTCNTISIVPWSLTGGKVHPSVSQPLVSSWREGFWREGFGLFCIALIAHANRSVCWKEGFGWFCIALIAGVNPSVCWREGFGSFCIALIACANPSVCWREGFGSFCVALIAHGTYLQALVVSQTDCIILMLVCEQGNTLFSELYQLLVDVVLVGVVLGHGVLCLVLLKCW